MDANTAAVMGEVSKYLKKNNNKDIIAIQHTDIDEVIFEFMEILHKHVARAHQGNFYVRAEIKEPVWDGDKVRVDVELDHEGATHESWYQEKYPKGVDLILILNNGYTAKKAVWTYDHEWGGNKRFSRTNYEGAHFIQSAVAEFNQKYGANGVADYDKSMYK